MTVITKPIIIKEDKSKETLVPLTSDDPLSSSLSSLPPPTPSVRPQIKKKAPFSHRLACLYHCFLLLAATLALCVALMGAIHLLRQMRRPRYVRGVCSLPIPVNRILDESMISGDFSEGQGGEQQQQQQQGRINSLQPIGTPELVGERVSLTEKISADGQVELDYELDLDFEEFEEFQMPQISHGRYLHDFKMNQTAIIDPDGNRCFVMPLDQDEVPKPKSFMQIIKSLRHGVYGLDIAEVRVDTRVVLPPVEDPEYFGFFIGNACAGRTTYRLKPLTEVLISKRSVDAVSARGYQFVEFTGKTLLKYNIVNMDQF